MHSAQQLALLGWQMPADATVLVIHDQHLVSSTLAIVLRDKGFNAYCLPLTDLAAVQTAALAYAPGLVLLDRDLGSRPDGQGIDSLDLAGSLRAQGWTVLVITGMTSLDRIADAVVGLLKQSLTAPRTGSSIASPLPSSSNRDRDHARPICPANAWTTEPREPSTLPKRTET